ncbi:hypothetical protein D3C76_1672490 [compost metagenome]
MGGAQGGLQGQLGGDVCRQAEFDAGGGHGFDQQEEVRRAGTRNGGDRIQLLFFIQPQGNANRR